jgi:hypothetical protein
VVADGVGRDTHFLGELLGRERLRAFQLEQDLGSKALVSGQ